MSDFLLQQFELSHGRSLPGERPGEPRAPDAGARPRAAAGPQVHALHPGHADPDHEAPGHVRRDPQGRHPAAPPVPVVPAGVELHRAGGQRSAGGGDQADGLSHRHGLGADEAPDRRRAQRQGSHGGGGADGALRRGSQHQLGLQARGGRRARGLRRRRPQDPRQDVDGGAPRGNRPAALRPPGHRQLPLAHRHALHRLRSVHLQRGDVRGRERRLPAADRPGQGGQAEAPVAVAVHAAHRSCSRRSRARPSTPAPASRRASSPR